MLALQAADGKDCRVILGYRTTRSDMSVVCGVDHSLATECASSLKADWGGHGARVVFFIDAEPGKPIALTKYMTFHTSRSDKTGELSLRTGRTLDRVVGHGFDRLLADQRTYLDDFWHCSDVQISAQHPRLQQWMPLRRPAADSPAGR